MGGTNQDRPGGEVGDGCLATTPNAAVPALLIWVPFPAYFPGLTRLSGLVCWAFGGRPLTQVKIARLAFYYCDLPTPRQSD